MSHASRRTKNILLIVALILIAIGMFLSRKAESDESPTAARFNVTDLKGRELKLGDLLARGPVLLDFWATWCKPCAASLPELQAMHEAWADRGLTIVGVSIDGPRNFSKVRPFVARTGLTYPIVLDHDGRLQRDFHVTAVPTAVLIDTTGAIVRVRQGYRPGEDRSLAAEIESLLVGNATPADAGGSPADSTDSGSP